MFTPGLTELQTRAVNAIMSKAYFPRAKKWLYPRFCGSFTSTSAVEPFSIFGSIPPLLQYNGMLKASDLRSWSMQVPNLLYKNIVRPKQEDYEFDQTRVLMHLSAAEGIRVAEHPDMLFASRLLKASNTSSVTVKFRGQTYTQTFDGKPYFSQTHDDGRQVQSNIVQGHLPHSKGALMGSSWATNALLMQQDLAVALDRIRSWKDPDGVNMFPSMSMEDNVVIVVPPILEQIAKLAFATKNSVINQTTNVAPQYVRDVVTHGYLGGFLDPDTGEDILPMNETDWYILLVDDMVKPFYMQQFRPVKADELFPDGYNADAVIKAIMSEDNAITVDQATLFASTRVDTTFRRIGAEADAYTIESESFLMSGRHRGNMVYGPWFTGIRIAPSGGDLDTETEIGESSSSSASLSSSSSPSSSSSSQSISSSQSSSSGD